MLEHIFTAGCLLASAYIGLNMGFPHLSELIFDTLHTGNTSSPQAYYFCRNVNLALTRSYMPPIDCGNPPFLNDPNVRLSLLAYHVKATQSCCNRNRGGSYCLQTHLPYLNATQLNQMRDLLLNCGCFGDLMSSLEAKFPRETIPSMQQLTAIEWPS
jgi:hypothetical protein